jgi:hypothetical protein
MRYPRFVRSSLWSLVVALAACGAPQTPGDAGSDAGGDAAATDGSEGAADAGGDAADAGEEADAGTPNTPPSVTVTTPTSPASGLLLLSYRITDAERDRAEIDVELLAPGETEWVPATRGPAGEGLTNLVTSPSGTPHTFAWSSVADLGKGAFTGVKLRITARDTPSGAGAPAETTAFAVANGLFLRKSDALDGASVWHAVAGDADADGDHDLVALTDHGAKLLLNRGYGAFDVAALQKWPATDVRATHAAFGDVDGDDDVDIVVAVNGAPEGVSRRNRLYLNDGAGVFTDATAARLPDADDQSERALLADVDGDDDLDLFFANSGSQQDELLLNNGSGFFTEANARLPADTLMGAGAVAGRFDADADVDLVIVNFITSQGFRFYENDAAGNFSDATAARMPAQPTGGTMLDVQAADLEPDGDLDLFVTNGFGEGWLLVNDGTGHFTYGATPPAGPYQTTAAFADFNLDGKIDLFVARTSGPSSLLLNKGSRAFEAAPASAFTSPTGYHRGCAAADFDGDSDPDVFVGVEYDSPSEIWINGEAPPD